MKFGLFLHWGAYSQIGVDASWSLDYDSLPNSWPVDILGPAPTTQEEMTEYRDHYWNLSTTFNPTKYYPASWASAAKQAGMQYFVMTTKHHDGFAMYNTSFAASADQPIFSATRTSPIKRDLYGELADAMRAEDIAVGAYFSKPDWHSKLMWNDTLGFPADRNANYNVDTNKGDWDEFSTFVTSQLKEIQQKYDPFMFWLDFQSP